MTDTRARFGGPVVASLIVVSVLAGAFAGVASADVDRSADVPGGTVDARAQNGTANGTSATGTATPPDHEYPGEGAENETVELNETGGGDTTESTPGEQGSPISWVVIAAVALVVGAAAAFVWSRRGR